MAGPLVTLEELAIWSQRDVDEVEADPYAAEVVELLSDVARFIGGTDWSLTPTGEDEVQVPVDVRLVVLRVVRRTYVNPDSEIQSSIGPIQSSVEGTPAAMAGHFTESDLAVLEKYNPDGDPNGLWVQPTTRGEDPLPVAEVLYVPDDQQVNISEADSAWPTWDIPMFNEGDPGGEG